MTMKNSLCGIDFGGGKASLNLTNIKKTLKIYKRKCSKFRCVQSDD